MLLAAALEMPADKRPALLDAMCVDDPALHQRLETLLAAHNQVAPSPPAVALAVKATMKIEFADAADEAVGKTIGRYKVLEKVGEGGCGVVYVAEQTEPVRRRVALKVIKLGMDTKQVIARFEAERQALAMMDHPNIAKVLDAGATENGRPYFVMELVRGIKITEYCDQANLTTTARLDLFIKVCQAIQHAHQKGIIHRDIKPSNMLVTLHDGVPVPKVIDFGIAKATVGQTLTDKTVYTQLQQFIGTPAYMSPEQAEMSGLDIDTRSDIYSLGVLLYELLTGRTPFDAEELASQGLDAMRKTIREKEPMRPSTRLAALKGEELTTTAKRRSVDTSKLMHQLKGDLDWIVMKCLEKDRTRRYETANGLAFDLKRHLSNEPVLARPPSAAYRFQKAFRRNKLTFSAAAAVVLALATGLTLAALGWRQTRVERDKALQAEAGEEAQRKVAQASALTAQKQRKHAEAEKAEADHLLYVANMNLAQQAWDQNNILRLRQLLQDTQDSPYRGLEWYYWQFQTHLDLKTLRGHLGAVNGVAFSPDSQRIVTGSEDGTAKVWEAATGKELLTLNGHRSAVSSVAFAADGRWIVTGSQDKTAKVWEAASGKELLTLNGPSGYIASVAFSPDGQRIVTGSWDQMAKVWEAATGKELLTLKGHSGSVFSVAFSPDGQRIVTGSGDKTAKVWEAATGKELLTLKGHTLGINAVAFSPDGQRIVTGSQDSTARVWEAATGMQLLTLIGHGSQLSSVAFSPDGQWIVTGSSDKTARVWEAVTGKELLTLKGHSLGINAVAFSPDGQWIVTGSGEWSSTADDTAKVWKATGSKEVLTLKGHIAEVRALAFSADGQRIVTGSGDKTAKVWDAATGKELFTLKGHSGYIASVAFSPDGQRIVTGSLDQTAKVWDVASRKELLTLKGHSGGVSSVAFSPDGQRIVTGSQDQTAKVWDSASGKELLTFRGHRNGIVSVAFSADGQRIVTGSHDQTAKVWDAVSGKELLTLKCHWVRSVAFSPDSLRIVTGSDDSTAKVWDATSGKELLTLKGHSGPVVSTAFSPDGQRILTGSNDETAKVWEADSGRELLTLKTHSNWVSSVALSPDGQRIDSNWVSSVAFSPDGQRIVTGSWDQTAKVWTLATAKQAASWQAEERAAEQHLAALQREQSAEEDRQRVARARDEGAIKRWLILAPIPLPPGLSGAEGLAIEQIEGEGRLRPKAEEMSSVGGGNLKWRDMAFASYEIDFNAIVGQGTEYSVAYAVTYIESEADRTGLVMLVGSDDQARIYLNQREIYRELHPMSWEPDRDTVTGIKLKAGLNVLVFKVVNEQGDWGGSIRFTDAQGNPVTGIKVTLNPDAKE
jgi:eukaryotic-like serine/threonine-protein kinase